MTGLAASVAIATHTTTTGGATAIAATADSTLRRTLRARAREMPFLTAGVACLGFRGRAVTAQMTGF